jgi:hypothetical protein
MIRPFVRAMPALSAVSALTPMKLLQILSQPFS